VPGRARHGASPLRWPAKVSRRHVAQCTTGSSWPNSAAILLSGPINRCHFLTPELAFAEASLAPRHPLQETSAIVAL
jgi:hypothetical protein